MLSKCNCNTASTFCLVLLLGFSNETQLNSKNRIHFFTFVLSSRKKTAPTCIFCKSSIDSHLEVYYKLESYKINSVSFQGVKGSWYCVWVLRQYSELFSLYAAEGHKNQQITVYSEWFFIQKENYIKRCRVMNSFWFNKKLEYQGEYSITICLRFSYTQLFLRLI